jgi:Txe/YoeB family toxin of Txe-Axe toxin-antitoxin module
MKVKPLNKKQIKFIEQHDLKIKYEKAVKLFEIDHRYPSLQLELLEPKNLKFYSFRLNTKYRVVFIVVDGEAEVIAITNHYKK